MKIALICPEYPGCGPAFGIGRYCAVLRTGLEDRGHRVLVLVVTPNGRHRIEGSDHRVQPSPRWQRGPWRAPMVRRWLAEQLAGWGPEVVEYSNWGGLGVTCGVPAVCRLSSPALLSPLATGARRLLRLGHHRNELRAVRRADLVVADSGAAAAMATRLYRRRCDRIVHHGIDPGAAPPESSQRHDLLYLGRLEPRKGVDRLLRAWPTIHARHPTRRLHLVGDDPWGIAATVALPGIRHHGHLDDAALQRLKARCVLQVVPSRFESFGLVVLEAWRDGLAVVASDGGALPEVVGEAGVVVPAGRPALLTRSILEVLADPSRRERLVRLGRERLVRHFAADRFVDASLAVYRSCLETAR